MCICVCICLLIPWLLFEAPKTPNGFTKRLKSPKDFVKYPHICSRKLKYVYVFMCVFTCMCMMPIKALEEFHKVP